MRIVGKTFLLIISILFLSSCATTAMPISSYVSGNMIKANKSVKKLDQYDSPYTMCYQNSDGTYTVYMFSSPISYKDSKEKYEYIDNSIIKNPDRDMKNTGYIYRNANNDIKTYFPQKDDQNIIVRRGNDSLSYSLTKQNKKISSAKLETCKNEYGDNMQAVTYGDSSDPIQVRNYVTKAGVKSEIVLNKYPGTDQISFQVKIPGYDPELNDSGYVEFTNKSIGGIIYSGIVKDSFHGKYTEKDGHVSINNSVNYENGSLPDTYTVTFTLDQNFLTSNNTVYPVRFDPSFELYLNKQPDSGAYSNLLDNCYLSPYSLIGNSDVLGIGRQFIRFRFDYFFQCDPDSIISSFYHVKELTGFSDNEDVTLNKLNQQWSSTQLNWLNQLNSNNSVCSNNITGGGDIAFDITKYSKACFSDSSWMTESYGALMKGSENKDQYRDFGSSDNSEYPPYVEINLNNIPKKFTYRDNINPNN